MGYSASDIITTLFRVVRNYGSMNEYLKLEYIKVGLGGPAMKGQGACAVARGTLEQSRQLWAMLRAVILLLLGALGSRRSNNVFATEGALHPICPSCPAANWLHAHAHQRWRELAAAAVGPAGGAVPAHHQGRGLRLQQITIFALTECKRA